MHKLWKMLCFGLTRIQYMGYNDSTTATKFVVVFSRRKSKVVQGALFYVKNKSLRTVFGFEVFNIEAQTCKFMKGKSFYEDY